MPLEPDQAARAFGKCVDFGRTSDDYSRLRPGPPASLYDRIETHCSARTVRGLRVADLGAGTGCVSIELALRGASCIAIDPARNQLDAAARLAEERGVRIETREARAEETALPAATFDLCIACQAWHWFDPACAGREIMRLLKPGGLVMCCNFDYLPSRSEVARRTEELVLRYTPGWPLAGDSDLHRRAATDLPAAGFALVEHVEWEHAQIFTHKGWRGRMRTCNGVGGHHPPEIVARFDADLAAMLRHEFPEEPMSVPHRVSLVVARKPI